MELNLFTYIDIVKRNIANELVDYNKETKDDFVVINDGHTADYIVNKYKKVRFQLLGMLLVELL